MDQPHDDTSSVQLDREESPIQNSFLADIEASLGQWQGRRTARPRIEASWHRPARQDPNAEKNQKARIAFTTRAKREIHNLHVVCKAEPAQMDKEGHGAVTRAFAALNPVHDIAECKLTLHELADCFDTIARGIKFQRTTETTKGRMRRVQKMGLGLEEGHSYLQAENDFRQSGRSSQAAGRQILRNWAFNLRYLSANPDQWHQLDKPPVPKKTKKDPLQKKSAQQGLFASV